MTTACLAEYNVTRAVSWTDLNTAGLIFGKDYTSDGVDYTLRAPSVEALVQARMI